MKTRGLSAAQKQSLRDSIEALAKTTKRILLLELEGDQKQVKLLVEPGIEMKGVRLWFLLASCLIASIGLNTNSSAVIIGAMLISPLMGPILGLGFGLATASRRMIRTSIKNLLFSVFISLAVASLYFLISPFQDATSEILARTSPNLLDFLVAVAAAFAGVIALNSTSLAGAVPGVAIATAIMPPLCASAYGIAHGDLKIALGAFYLFFVNAVAIAVVAYLLFKRMHFSEDAQESAENGGIKPTFIVLAILFVVAPLGWSLWDAWRDNFESRSVSRLVQSYKGKLEVVSWQWNSAKGKKLVLYSFNKATSDVIVEFENALRNISPEATLELHESNASPEMEELAAQFKSSQFSALLGNPKIVEGLIRLASEETTAGDLMQSVLKYESDLTVLAGEDSPIRGYIRSQDKSSEVIFVITAKNQRERNRIKRDQIRLQDWIKTKLPEGVTVKFEVI